MGNRRQVDDYGSIVSNYDPSKNSTNPLMTKYELNQILSLRMLHISMGMPIFLTSEEVKATMGSDTINLQSNIELRKIAVHELLAGKLPYIVRRFLPNQKVEYWRLRDMDITAVEYMIQDSL